MNQHLQSLARRQHALLTSRQFEQYASRSLLRTYERNGVLTKTRRGVYKVSGAPETWLQAMNAAILAGPSETITSHMSAGRIWDMPYCGNAEVEVTVPLSGSHRMSHCVLHQADVPEWQRSRRHGLAVMSPARTIVSLALYFDSKRLGKILDDCAYRKLVSPQQVYDTLVEIGPRGRSFVSRLWPVLEDRLGMGDVQSDLETKAARALRIAGSTRHVTQHPVFVVGRAEPYHLDFAWPDHKIALEPQGFTFHDGRRGTFDDDRTRMNDLTDLGWKIYVATTNTPMADVVSQALHAVDSARQA